jgi:hypothetical protein
VGGLGDEGSDQVGRWFVQLMHEVYGRDFTLPPLPVELDHDFRVSRLSCPALVAATHPWSGQRAELPHSGQSELVALDESRQRRGSSKRLGVRCRVEAHALARRADGRVLPVAHCSTRCRADSSAPARKQQHRPRVRRAPTRVSSCMKPTLRHSGVRSEQPGPESPGRGDVRCLPERYAVIPSHPPRRMAERTREDVSVRTLQRAQAPS